MIVTVTRCTFFIRGRGFVRVVLYTGGDRGDRLQRHTTMVANIKSIFALFFCIALLVVCVLTCTLYNIIVDKVLLLHYY